MTGNVPNDLFAFECDERGTQRERLLRMMLAVQVRCHARIGRACFGIGQRSISDTSTLLARRKLNGPTCSSVSRMAELSQRWT
jgi:hypothetical protein